MGVVIHGQESILCTLDAKWEKLHFQTNRSLEQCFMSSLSDAADPNEASSPTLRSPMIPVILPHPVMHVPHPLSPRSRHHYLKQTRLFN